MPSGLHVLGRRKPQDAGQEITATALPSAPSLSPEKWNLLARWQKDPAKGEAMRSILGKVWNAPNTAIGLGYGLLGYGVGKVMGKNPHIGLGQNAVQFTNNPFGGVSAITLGNATVWNGDPYDPKDARWHENGQPALENGHSIPDHEEQHTRQGERLGPLYLPSNLFGGAYSLLRDHEWRGDSNWNERGPEANPPRPWARRPE